MQNTKKLAKEIQGKFQDCLMKMEVDDEGHLKNFVFADITMKKLYSNFKDVVLLDSTYRTNKYKMPLLVVAGLNEYGKTFMLGFGVVANEEYESVKWILQNLFEYLGESPEIICTDACPSLAKAITNLFPNTKHLLCAWHLSQNIKKHLTGISK